MKLFANLFSFMAGACFVGICQGNHWTWFPMCICVLMSVVCSANEKNVQLEIGEETDITDDIKEACDETDI